VPALYVAAEAATTNQTAANCGLQNWWVISCAQKKTHDVVVGLENWQRESG
jgi:hypothetical protein